MPTFLFFKNGKKWDEVIGADIKRVESLVKQYSSGSSSFPSGGRVLGSGAPVSTQTSSNHYLIYILFSLFFLYLMLNKGEK